MSAEYIYLFIRQDLSPAQQVIQAAHAIHLVGNRSDPISAVPNAVLFGVKSEQELIEAKKYLEGEGIESEIFYEPDVQAHTAIATYPLTGKARKPMQRFALV